MYRPVKKLCRCLFIMTMPFLLWMAELQAKVPEKTYVDFLQIQDTLHRDTDFDIYGLDFCLKKVEGKDDHSYQFVDSSRSTRDSSTEKNLNLALFWIWNYSDIGKSLIKTAKEDDLYICFPDRPRIAYNPGELSLKLPKNWITFLFSEEAGKYHNNFWILISDIVHELHHHFQHKKGVFKTAPNTCLENHLDWIKIRETDAAVISAYVLHEIMMNALPQNSRMEYWNQYVHDPNIPKTQNWPAALARVIKHDLQGRLTLSVQDTLKTLIQEYYKITHFGKTRTNRLSITNVLPFQYEKEIVNQYISFSDSRLKKHFSEACPKNQKISFDAIRKIFSLHTKEGYWDAKDFFLFLEKQKKTNRSPTANFGISFLKKHINELHHH